MQIDFDAEIHPQFPVGWRTARDITEGFLVAATMELEARRRMLPMDPFSPEIFPMLSPTYRYDSFASLARMYEPFARLPLLDLVWRFTDWAIANTWSLRANDPAATYDLALAQLQGLVLGAHGTALFMAAFPRRWFADGEAPELSWEEWEFANGNTIPGSGAGALPASGALYMDSVWLTAFRLVERHNTNHYLNEYTSKVNTVQRILVEGGLRGRAGHSKFDLWPGWPELN